MANVVTANEHDCLHLPPWVTNIPHYPFVVLEIQILVVFCVTQMLHILFFKHIGMPPLVSQLVAGLVLGPAGLGKFSALREVVFPESSNPVLICISLVTYAFSLFLIATTMDFSIIKRTGKKVILIGLLTLISSLAANAVVQRIIKPDPKDQDQVSVAVTSLPVTAHPVLVRLLTDIGLVNSELGRLALATGLCVELCSIALTMAINNIIPALGNGRALMKGILRVAGIGVVLLTIIFAVRPFMKLLIKLTPKGRPVRDTFLLLGFLSMLLGGLATDALGQWVLLGAFMVGGGLPDGPPLGSALVEKFGPLILGILYPFFVTTIAMRIDFKDINFSGSLVYDLGMLITTTLVTKILVCYICGICSSMSSSDALSLAFILCAKGFLELATLFWLTDVKVLKPETFTVLSLHVVIMSAVVPLALKILYDPMRKYGGYQIRDIMHLKQSTSLKMVVCVLRTDHIASITNLLRIINPNAEASVVANVLHLMKLVGRCQPLFISHDMQKKQTFDQSYSHEVIWHFNRLQHYSRGVLSTHVYTALSQPAAMHEYICTLALDKVASLIILPFHRKYGIEGAIEFEDHEQRALNASVLERSPCSVAVLIDRSYINVRRAGMSKGGSLDVLTEADETLTKVAVIFIGGNDDREALALAKRMSRGLKIKLTVIRLALPNDHEEFLNSLDSTAVEKLHDTMSGKQQIMYMEMTVTDGAQTALKLRDIVQEYDLLIVGRRIDSDSLQTIGLSESSEIKEVGILGDFLCSPDLKCKTSILVVQRQLLWK